MAVLSLLCNRQGSSGDAANSVCVASPNIASTVRRLNTRNSCFHFTHNITT